MIIPELPFENAAYKISPVYTAHNKIELIRGGKPYFERMEHLIDLAVKTIHLQVYIFDDDETGNRIAAALIRAVQRGVAVYLVVDGYASQSLSDHYIQHLKQKGIQFRWFEKIFHSRHFYIGRRLHHKLLVVDAYHCLTGGVNISNRYNDLEEPAWMDWAVHADGDIAFELHKRCVEIWNGTAWGTKIKNADIVKPVLKIISSECLIRVRVNDWVRAKNQVSRSYLEMLKKAKHNIILMSSYFVPGRQIRENIIAAAKRGVTVKIIVAGMSDVTLAKWAEKYMYRSLLKNNVELYEYNKTVLHGKISTYDGKWVTVGSYNINNLSAYASIELNLDVLNDAFASHTAAALEKIIQQDCVRITEADFLKKNTWFRRMIHRFSYDMLRLALFLFTFYFRQEKTA